MITGPSVERDRSSVRVNANEHGDPILPRAGYLKAIGSPLRGLKEPDWCHALIAQTVLVDTLRRSVVIGHGQNFLDVRGGACPSLRHGSNEDQTSCGGANRIFHPVRRRFNLKLTPRPFGTTYFKPHRLPEYTSVSGISAAPYRIVAGVAKCTRKPQAP